MPEWIGRNIQQFAVLNPNYEIRLHLGPAELSAKYEPVYEAKYADHEWARRSDLLRLCILKKHGGWYFDTDFFPFRPIECIVREWNLTGDRCFTVPVGEIIANGILGACPEDPGILSIVDELDQYLRLRIIEHQWGAFGTVRAVRAFEKHPKHFQLGRREQFFPVSENDRERAIDEYKQIANGVPYTDFYPESTYMMHLHCQDELELDKIR